MISFLHSAHCSSVICGFGLGAVFIIVDHLVGVLLRLAQLLFAVQIVFARLRGDHIGQHEHRAWKFFGLASSARSA